MRQYDRIVYLTYLDKLVGVIVSFLILISHLLGIQKTF